MSGGSVSALIATPPAGELPIDLPGLVTAQATENGVPALLSCSKIRVTRERTLEAG